MPATPPYPTPAVIPTNVQCPLGGDIINPHLTDTVRRWNTILYVKGLQAEGNY